MNETKGRQVSQRDQYRGLLASATRMGCQECTGLQLESRLGKTMAYINPMGGGSSRRFNYESR